MLSYFRISFRVDCTFFIGILLKPGLYATVITTRGNTLLNEKKPYYLEITISKQFNFINDTSGIFLFMFNALGSNQVMFSLLARHGMHLVNPISDSTPKHGYSTRT